MINSNPVIKRLIAKAHGLLHYGLRLFIFVIFVIPMLMGCAGTAPPVDKVIDSVTNDNVVNEKTVDTLLQPGIGAGKITAVSSRTDLTTIYGAENVVDKPFYIGEGICERGTRLFPDDSTLALDILWGDKKTQSHPKILQIESADSLWHTADGMVIGLNVTDLVALNKKPFEFSGFGWDYGGYVTSWNGGLFDKEGKGVGVRLDLLNSDETLPDALNALGEGTFSSKVLAPVQDKLVVRELFFRFQENFENFSDNGEFQKECELVEADLEQLETP